MYRQRLEIHYKPNGNQQISPRPKNETRDSLYMVPQSWTLSMLNGHTFASKKVCPDDFSCSIEATGDSTNPYYFLTQIESLRFPGKWIVVSRVRELSRIIIPA